LVRFVMPVAIVTAVIGVGIYTVFYTHILKGTQEAQIPVMALAKRGGLHRNRLQRR
jgi:hypothetical protein